MEQETLAETIKNQIRDRRAKRNMTLGQLGIKIGAAPTVIWQWEQGRHSPSIWYMVRLSEVFGRSVDELCGCEGCPLWSEDDMDEDCNVDCRGNVLKEFLEKHHNEFEDGE